MPQDMPTSSNLYSMQSNNVPQATAQIPLAPPAGSGMQQGQDVKFAAADAEVIEQSWVSRIKQILNTTRQDPFTMQQQMAGLRAQYIQERFGKTIKQHEERRL